MNKEDVKMVIPTEGIEGLIHIIRGQKVILDQDLAVLYGVKTKVFNQTIKRNLDRFPKDFAFQLNQDEWDFLRSQIVTLKKGRGKHRKYTPYVFTEHGVVMASNLLKSNQATEVSVKIVRAFVRLRQIIAIHKETAKEVSDLKNFFLKHSNSNDREFKRIWKTIDKLAKPINDKKEQKKIGFDLG